MKLPKPKDFRIRVQELKRKGHPTQVAVTLALAEIKNDKLIKEKKK